jgi:hypothetical protein
MAVACLAAAAGLWPAVGQADLTLTGYSAAGAFGMPMSSQESIKIRETSIRRDYIDRGQSYSNIFDLAKRQVAVIDHAAKKVEIHDLRSLQGTAEISAAADKMKLTLKKTGIVQPLRHWNCEEYILNASIPAKLGNEETVFHLNGQVWVANHVPELGAVKKLINLTKQADFFLGIPSVAKVTPAQALLLSEIIRKVAPKGLPCGCDLHASYEGSGPMANLARKMPTRFNVSFQDVSGAPLKADTFVLPAGYPVKP